MDCRFLRVFVFLFLCIKWTLKRYSDFALTSNYSAIQTLGRNLGKLLLLIRLRLTEKMP